MAAKRVRPNDGDQGFDFLSSHNVPDTESTVTESAESGPSTEPAANEPDGGLPEIAEIAKAGAAVEKNSLPPEVPPAVDRKKSDEPDNSDSESRPNDSKSGNVSLTAPMIRPTDQGSSKLLIGVIGYAIALTLLFLGLLLTGHISLFGNPALESLPDLRPLAPNEFRKIPDGTALPEGHVLRLGEARRFGDIVVTPVKLTEEPLKFQGFLSGTINETLSTLPVLKLWLNFENVSDDYAFPPFDSELMSNRTPPHSSDAATRANTFLTIFTPSEQSAATRKLNYLHTMDNNFVIVGQDSAKLVEPGDSLLTFIAASEDDVGIAIDESTQFVWRVQFRKGVNQTSGNGVTTLIDVSFSGSEIESAEVVTPG
ncbi:MAG: hypothetical protein O2856_00710 [Planctomycetota bacterium]|nr:hypothetical protein [Planctomycetota bacterium]